jgi:hypothetical protein
MPNDPKLLKSFKNNSAQVVSMSAIHTVMFYLEQTIS